MGSKNSNCFLLLSLLILINFIFVYCEIDILKQTIIQQSYYYDNELDSNLSGCNITILVNIKYDSESGQISRITTFDTDYKFNSELIFSNETIGLFKLDGVIKIVGNNLTPIIVGLNGEFQSIFNQQLSCSCEGPPISSDLGIVIVSNNSIIPISRKNEYLFEVAIKVTALTNYMDMSFIFSNPLGSIPYSLFYEQLSFNEYILKFKLRDPSLVQNLGLIEIIPQNIRGGGISIYPLNYTSFTIYTSIKESNQSQFSNILIYPNGEEITNEKFAYITFDVNNDNDYIVPALVNNLNSIDTLLKLDNSIAFPIGGNKTHSKFIGIIEPPNVQGFIWSLSSTDNKTIVSSKNLYSGSFETSQFSINPSPQTYSSFAEFFFFLTIDLPTEYKIQTLISGSTIQSYSPYWCIEQYNSTSSNTYFVRLVPFPVDYYNQKLDVYASFLIPSTFSFGTFGTQPSNPYPPIIEDILLIEKPSSDGYILRFKVINVNGDQFSHLVINDKILNAIDIVSGDTYNEGYFELHVNNTFIQSMSKLFYITACNIKFECSDNFYIPSEFTNYQPFPSLILPNYKLITIFDISYIKFFENNLNTNNQSKKNTIYLLVNNLNGNGDANTIYFKLDNYDRINNDFITFAWNSVLKMFECKFEIPANYYTGNIDYFIRIGNHTYSYSSIYSALGSNSTLNVSSENADMLPPLVSNIVTYQDSSILKLNNSNSNSSNVFGWDVQIEEGINGFKYAEFNVTGKFDKLPYQFKFNETDYINGQGILSIRINIVEFVCITQDYTISSAYLIDKQGYSTSKTSSESISPMFKEFLAIPITVECQDDISEYNSSNPDVELPYVNNFLIDPDYSSIDYSIEGHNVIKINFTINDNESGLSPRHHPTFYFEDMFGNIISSTVGSGMKVEETSMDYRIYSCEVEFPYGFGYPGGVTISMYGIVDKFMNVRGYNSVSLKAQVDGRDFQLIPLINVGLSSSSPYIADLAPTFSSDWKTAQFVLKGSFFGLSKNDVSLSIKYIPQSTSSSSDDKISTTTTTTTTSIATPSPTGDISTGNNGGTIYTLRSLLSNENEEVPFDIVFFSGNQLIIEADLSNAISQNIQIVFNVSGQLSNTYTFLLPTQVLAPTTTTTSTTDGITSATSTATTGGSSATTGGSGSSTTGISTTGGSSSTGFDCSKQSDCGGPDNGVCVSQDTCRCINSWIGANCMAKPLEGISISVNPNAPSASLNQKEDSNGFKLSSLINLYQIREINPFNNNQIIHEFDLQDKWVPVTSISGGSSSSNQFIYSNSLSNDQGTIIYATLSIYEQQSTFEFAGQQYSINPNSIKFSINITNYQVENQLNNIELIMQAQLNSTQTKDICSKKTTTKSSEFDQLSVQINNKSLYCRFLNSALIDGVRVINNLTHVNLNDEFSALVQPNSGQYYYGIVLPSFKNYLLLDPDFSLLLETSTLNGDYESSTCSPNSSKSRISNGAIVGIVVGGAAFITIIIILVMTLMFRKYRFSSLTMKFRKFNAKRRNRNSFSLKNYN